MQQFRTEGIMLFNTHVLVEEDWVKYKSVITSLYIKQGLTLDHVRRTMRERYGFQATYAKSFPNLRAEFPNLTREKMYKIHFKRWKLRKYVSACDKEAVAGILDLYRRKGLEAPDISLNGRRIQLHLIRRHCRRDQSFGDICDDLPWQRKAKPDKAPLDKTRNLTDISSQYLPLSTNNGGLPCQSLSLSPQCQPSLEMHFDTTQNILVLTNQYFEWHFERNSNQAVLEFAKRPSTQFSPSLTTTATYAGSFWKFVISGLDLLNAGQLHRARLAFDQGCASAAAAFQEQRRGLLKLIYLLFSDDRWQLHPEYRTLILEFVSDMAAKVLGQTHPLSTITRLCRDPAAFWNSSQRIHELLVAIFRRYARQNTAEIGQLQRAHCDILRMNREYVDAERAAERLVSECETSHGRHGAETRYALRRLAHIYIDQQRYRDAESVFHDVIERARIDLKNNRIDESSIFSYQNLACLSDLDGDLERAETQWQLAFNGAVIQFGAGHYETEYCRQNLNCIRLRQGLLDPRTNVHDFHDTCALRRRPNLSAGRPLSVSYWASHSRLYIDGDL